METARRARPMSRLLRVTVLSLSLAFSASAAAGDEPYGVISAAPEHLSRGLIQERDVELLLGYVREAIRAMAEGREPPEPPRELETRAGELAAELKARGTLAGLMLLSVLEQNAKALRRELAPPPYTNLPPTVPYTPVSAGR
jgi:hypothetical protein